MFKDQVSDEEPEPGPGASEGSVSPAWSGPWRQGRSGWVVVEARAIGTVWEEGERFMERVGRGSAERGAVGGRQGDMCGGEAEGLWGAAGLQAAIGQTRECRGRQVFRD